jgi:tetratricopeptide (TPR) repeat protein
VCSSALFVARQSRLNKLDAAHAYSSFVEDARTALLHLHIPGTEPELHAIGRNAAANALQKFDVSSGNNLDTNSRFANLSSDQQKLVREQSAALRYSLAQLDRDTQPAGMVAKSDHSLPGEHQAHELLARTTGADVEDLQGLALLENHRYAEALPVWQKLSEADREDPIRWFLLGNAYAGAGRLQDAESCYTAVIALQPRAVAAYFNRGRCRYDQANYKGARDDFSSILKLRPNLATARINRALAHHSLGDHKQAEADANAAIAAGVDDPRAYFARALIRDALQDASGAAADRARGFELPPKDDKGWMARGIACLASDPEKAREQFEQGLQEFPDSPGLLKNLVHVYADRLQQPEKALPLIERLLVRRPADPTVLASRAVLNARLGNRSAAHRDAQQIAREATTPLTSMQLACVYALTAKKNPDDSATAMRFIQAALARDPRLVVRISRDPDFEAVRSLPEHASLVGAAARLIGTPDNPKPLQSTTTQTGAPLSLPK